ncbi:hypothetical protein CAI21_18485 [Alkalilimnicola ehrlichii]|uniref:Uncharacterized protein n=1 Tax=Alkalilimnicola ehrlichii TaxID=351052 RepID=A0A3E0WLI0_9GAMM|nr:hypothetical protein CAI21_18485 [Alkalilimnicola ehrlichii]RFA32836.1 hypothetical protein CAL65_18740 [Alkalilimnicola ehrlichii]
MIIAALIGAICIIELTYHVQRSWDPSMPMTLFYFTVNATTAMPWVVSGIILVGSVATYYLHARRALARAVAAAGEGKK